MGLFSKKHTDPVCGMKVEAKSAIKQKHDDLEYFFCSDSCAAKFRKDPTLYL